MKKLQGAKLYKNDHFPNIKRSLISVLYSKVPGSVDPCAAAAAAATQSLSFSS